jgi:hypothetical protein
MIVWLAEVSGIDTRLIRKAVDAIVESDPCQSQAAAVRHILPWPLVARYLGRITPRTADLKAIFRPSLRLCIAALST